ncbi:PhnA-like protein [Agrobacterium vaccinii]|jgi:cellobiose-specific phosphotransferase system component IIA|uniref:PhnA-like protein n=1 Tax=Agrobacterium vaccinii TaxID=2735528 RepID=UPI000DD05274|nr:PhnA-like protein [Agrobacterium vaccinii]UHS56737.1 PhnA-like protein [Agrobacterium vaccinii]
MTDQTRYATTTTGVHAPVLRDSIANVSWGSIFAGVAIALSLHLLLNLLGLAIGAGVIDPAQNDTPTAASLSTGSVIWVIVSGIIAAFIGAYVASRLSGRVVRSTGALHGLASWAVTTLIVFYLLTTSVGALVGGAFTGVTSVFSGAGSTIATAATAAAPSLATANNPMSTIEQRIREASGGNDPQALRDAAVSAMRAALTGDQAQADDARNRAADALARAQNIPVDQARQQVTDYENQYKQAVEQAKKTATEAAQATATGVSTAAYVAFGALLIGAIAALFGGNIGAAHTDRRRETIIE